MEIPNRFYRTSIKALILDETRTKFLLAQAENGKWELPGGGLDWGESPAEGLRREIKEEMGLEATCIAKNPCYFTTSKSDLSSFWVSNTIYETTVKNLDFTPSDECVAIRFVCKGEALLLDLFTGTKVFLEVFDPANHK
jgi:8-oxo-dGTP pyrophosphatase MutT (NUDIX family)